MFPRGLQPFFNQLCLLLRADDIQSAGVTMHIHIHIHIYILDINTEYVQSVFTLEGIAVVCPPAPLPLNAPPSFKAEA